MSGVVFTLSGHVTGTAAESSHRASVTFSADKYSTNIDTGVTKAKGNVKIKLEHQDIQGDEVEMNSQTGQVIGHGHVVFTQGDVQIVAQDVDFNSNTGLGKFHLAILRKENELYVESRQLSRVGDFRYLGEDVKVSTCLDCPQSWSVTGSYADVEVEGYAEIHHALLQVKDSPILYFPVFIFPIKTKRQSGVLTPQLYSNHPDLGYQFKLPYFWAMSEDSDTTWTYTFATNGGHRIASDLRYLFSDRSFITGKASFGLNATVPNVAHDRYGFSLEQRQQIEPRWTQRYRGELSSDTRYTSHYNDEFAGGLQPFLINEPSIAWQNDNYVSYGLLRFHRDNMIRAVRPVAGIDRLPDIGLSMPTRPLIGPVRWEWDSHAVSFRRKGDVVDPETNWIREGDRATLSGAFRFSSNILSYLSWEPKVEVRGDAYHFPAMASPDESAAFRGRLLLDQKVSSQIFRVYEVSDSELKAVKHSIEPSIRWSYAPPEATSGHRFFDADQSPRFDLFDPNSPDAQKITLGTVGEEQRLWKHHLLTLGLGTRVVGRYGEQKKTFEEFFSARVDQDISLAPQLRPDGAPTSRFSPLKISAVAAYAGLKLTSDLSIDFANTGDVDIVSDIAYAWSLYYVRLSEHIQNSQQAENRSKTVSVWAGVHGYGPWSIDVAQSYDILMKKSTSQTYQIYYGSPSKCWYFRIVLSKSPNQADPDRFKVDPYLAPILGAGFKSSLF